MFFTLSINFYQITLDFHDLTKKDRDSSGLRTLTRDVIKKFIETFEGFLLKLQNNYNLNFSWNPITNQLFSQNIALILYLLIESLCYY